MAWHGAVHSAFQGKSCHLRTGGVCRRRLVSQVRGNSWHTIITLNWNRCSGLFLVVCLRWLGDVAAVRWLELIKNQPLEPRNLFGLFLNAEVERCVKTEFLIRVPLREHRAASRRYGERHQRCPALNHMCNQSKLTARRQVRWRHDQDA